MSMHHEQNDSDCQSEDIGNRAQSWHVFTASQTCFRSRVSYMQQNRADEDACLIEENARPHDPRHTVQPVSHSEQHVIKIDMQG
jgi:hypothetical protein